MFFGEKGLGKKDRVCGNTDREITYLNKCPLSGFTKSGTELIFCWSIPFWIDLDVTVCLFVSLFVRSPKDVYLLKVRGRNGQVLHHNGKYTCTENVCTHNVCSQVFFSSVRCSCKRGILLFFSTENNKYVVAQYCTNTHFCVSFRRYSLSHGRTRAKRPSSISLYPRTPGSLSLSLFLL